jgi:hypothetical protein
MDGTHQSRKRKLEKTLMQKLDGRSTRQSDSMGLGQLCFRRGGHVRRCPGFQRPTARSYARVCCPSCPQISSGPREFSGSATVGQLEAGKDLAVTAVMLFTGEQHMVHTWAGRKGIQCGGFAAGGRYGASLHALGTG